MSKRATILLVALQLTACAKTVLIADDYSQECVANSECVIVTVGDMCAACSHAFAAISVDALSACTIPAEGNDCSFETGRCVGVD